MPLFAGLRYTMLITDERCCRRLPRAAMLRLLDFSLLPLMLTLRIYATPCHAARHAFAVPCRYFAPRLLATRLRLLVAMLLILMLIRAHMLDAADIAFSLRLHEELLPPSALFFTFAAAMLLLPCACCCCLMS